MAYEETLIVQNQQINNILIADSDSLATASAKIVHVSQGGILSAGYVSAGGTCYVSSGGSANGLYLQGAVPYMYVYTGGKVTNLRIGGAGAKYLIVSGGTVITYIQRAAGNPVASVCANGVISNMTMQAGNLYVSEGAIYNANITGGAVTLQTAARIGGANTVIAAGTIAGNNPGHTKAPGVLTDLVVSGNWQFYGGIRLENVTINGGGYAHIQNDTVASGVTLAANGKGLFVSNGGVAKDVTMNAGSARIYGGADLVDVKATAGTINLFQANAGLGGSKTEFASGRLNGNAAAYAVAGTLYDFKTALDVRFVSGLHLENLTVTGAKTATLNEGVTASGVTVSVGGNNAVRVNYGAQVFDCTMLSAGKLHVSSGGYVSGLQLEGAHNDNIYAYVYDGGVVEDVGIGEFSYKNVIAYDGARINGLDMGGGEVHMSGGVVSGAVVHSGDLRIYAGGSAAAPVVSSGGTLTVYAGGSIEDAVIKTNTLLKLTAGANTGSKITLDFNAATGTADMQMIDYVNRLSPETEVWLTGVHTGATYFGSGGNLGREVHVSNGLYSFEVPGDNTEVVDAAYLRKYSFNGGRRLFTAAIEVTSGAALSLTDADTYEGGGNNRAALWTDDTDGDVVMVAENFDGDAYVTVGGATLTKALYGAAADFDGTVNLRLQTGELYNLAAGAQAGKTVGAVNLTLAGADMKGVGYAGGFGNVTGKVETLVYGGTMFKDFYAGALANHAKTGSVTSVHDVALTVWGGEFKGNVYGASAVKGSVAGVHTAGDVTLTITDGAATKSNFCCFTGGYATGSAADAVVYTVGSVTADISGGSWGNAHGGRGIFGGVFASGVTAQAGDVVITIGGDAAMGNVYGGGWAQKGGTSIVGNVDITIGGDATVANVFGGGTHSATPGSGGTTEVAGDVTITVAGGNITGSIYAKGQCDGDSVTGTAKVKFTGHYDCVCDVFGYSYVGGAGNSDALIFADYNGGFTGSIGGFAAIALTGNTELTLAPDAEKTISNSRWEFDLTERESARRGDALVKLDAFNDDSTVAVTFADNAQAQGDWNIARVGNVNAAVFELTIGDAVIATELGYDTAISGGDYAGWGFTLDDGMLKFKQLA